MKPFLSAIILLLTLTLPGCQDSREQIAQPLSESDLYKTIGEEIPFQTAMEWMELHKKQRSKSGRTELLFDYEVSSAQVNAMVGSVEDLAGVAFHYGLDFDGQQHIFLIPIGSSLSLWPTMSNRIILDANTGAPIDAATARLWAANYENANPSSIWFHFFGKHIFDQMRALPYFSSLDIEPALSSLDLTPQLLLLVWQDATTLLGRTQGTMATVYDASNACPPCAVK